MREIRTLRFEWAVAGALRPFERRSGADPTKRSAVLSGGGLSRVQEASYEDANPRGPVWVARAARSA